MGGDVLSKILDWSDRSTLVLFGDGAGAVVHGAGRATAAFSASSWAPTERAASISGCRAAARGTSTTPESFVKMNGREVFRFATRVLVTSATAVLEQCGREVDEVDVYVPHQANKRIIDHAVAKLGIPQEKTVVNVDDTGTHRRARSRSHSRTRARTAGYATASWC